MSTENRQILRQVNIQTVDFNHCDPECVGLKGYTCELLEGKKLKRDQYGFLRTNECVESERRFQEWQDKKENS